MFQFAEARQEQFVLHDSIFDSRLSGQTSEFESSRQIFGNRLLAINMLARRDRRFDCGGTLRGDLSIEIDGDVRISQGSIQVGSPAVEAKFVRQCAHSCFITAGQDWFRPEILTVSEAETALLADSEDRPNQMLVTAHPAGNTIHEDMDGARLHGRKSDLTIYHI